MHGKEVHESRRTNRCHPSEEGLRRDDPSDWRELQSEPEAYKKAHQPSKSKGTNGGSGIYPTSEGMAAEGSGQQVRKKRRQTYGIRRVRRWIQRQTGKSVNLKAILCLMRKLNLLSVVRRRRPYTRYQQSVHKYPNLLNRCFDQVRPNQFWVTDITYIPIPGSMLYLCAVLDLCGKVVLNWKIGSEMSSSLVTDTIREALQQEKVTDGLALHSDQGSQYTSKAFFDLTQAYYVSPSMSRPGCPYDNAAMKNFFGTLKTECLYRARFSSRAEVEQLVAEYIHFYIFERISLINSLTPLEIRSKTA